MDLVIPRRLWRKRCAIWTGKLALRFHQVWDGLGLESEVGYSLRAESVLCECEASLRRASQDVNIDFYEIHWPAEQ